MAVTSAVAREPFAIGDLPVGRVLDEAVELVRAWGWRAFAVGILPLMPIVIATSMFRIWLFLTPTVPYFESIAIDLTVTTLYAGLLSAPMAAGMLYVLGTGYLGQAVGIRDGYRHALRCWPRVAPISAVVYAVIYIGYNYFCIVPGVLLLTAVYLHLPVMALEGSGPIRAFGRNFGLMRGRILVILFTVCAQVSIQQTVFSLGFASGYPMLGAVLGWVLMAPVSLYFSAVEVVFYISARSRHEAVDLQILADAIGEEAGDGAQRL
jgi:hypothetical protein